MVGNNENTTILENHGDGLLYCHAMPRKAPLLGDFLFYLMNWIVDLFLFFSPERSVVCFSHKKRWNLRHIWDFKDFSFLFSPREGFHRTVKRRDMAGGLSSNQILSLAFGCIFCYLFFVLSERWGRIFRGEWLIAI